MGKRIALFFDGTWNDPSDETRVNAGFKLTKEIPGIQIKQYFEGLGVKVGQKFTGGVFAKGLGENVIEGYQYLLDTYEDGDDVFVFGFSRGAFTATSVCAMIMRYGLVENNGSFTAQDIFDRFKKWNEATLSNMKYNPEKGYTAEDYKLQTNSRVIPIKYIGIFDSVSTIGIPIGNFSKWSRNALKFHNPRPSKYHQNVRHALAINENRKSFNCILFNDFIKASETPEQVDKDRADWAERFEQRWFCGVHGDVGGGDNEDVAEAPFTWIMSKAEELGLEFKEALPSNVDVAAMPIQDNFEKVHKRLYNFMRLGMRFHRKIGAKAKSKGNDRIEPIHETIDPSVFERFRKDSKYRPKNLLKFFRNDVDKISKQIGEYTITPSERH